MKALTKLFNPLAMPIAESGLLPIWGIVRHTGRRSGRTYSTPIVVMATRDGFVVPLPWGERTDWCRNLVAARGGVIRWHGRDLAVRDPEIIDRATAASAFPAPLRAALPFVGISRFLRLRRADATERAA